MSTYNLQWVNICLALFFVSSSIGNTPYMIWRAELGGAGAGGALYHHLPFLPAEAAGKLNLEVTLQQCTNSR